MTRNFVEMCRKDAKWPAIVRDVPQFAKGGDKKTWSMSQDEIADFLAAVRIRSDDINAAFDAMKDERDALKDENVMLKLAVAAFEAGRRTARKAEALGVERADALAIGEAASGAVHDVRKAS